MAEYTMGMDIGSRTIKAVVWDGNAVAACRVTDSTANSVLQAQKVYEEVLETSGISPGEIRCTVSTGYGRDLFGRADRQITEITCHAAGIAHLLPRAKTVIDIGGQDSKVIRLEENKVIDFIMNDRCAAGTGRFLEVLERIFELTPENMFRLLENSASPCEISALCVVFAESEIVGHLASGKSPADVLAGALKSLALRTAAMARKVGLEAPVAFTGGVARNRALVSMLEKELAQPLLIPENPSISGALGAALLARKYMKAQ